MDDLKQPSSASYVELQYELNESNSEISRHHRDFTMISEICDAVVNNEILALDAVIAIRNIVG